MLKPACTFRRPCPTHYSAALRLQQDAIRCFRTSSRCNDDQFPNHYETLGVQPAATSKEIKKQFYTLSKSYHPDLHPNDPNASKRFVKISEAYAVLSAPSKRTSYDCDYARAFQRSSDAQQGQAYPSGSFSSAAASNGPGGRPPSGLSRRRTQFRGPPPSFYQSGGWGAQSAKRAEYAQRPSHAHESAGQSAGGEGESMGAGQDMPGMGPGGFAQGMENDVPHFDSKGHYQTHSTIERTRHRARRRMARAAAGEGASDNTGVLLGFFSVSGILLFGMGVSGAFSSAPKTSKTEEKI